MEKISLCGEWRGCGIYPQTEGYGKCRELHFTGIVPGCVHTDLLREKLIPDPFWRDSEGQCRFIENCGWYYEREFEISPEQFEKIDENGGAAMVFEGLDTYCDVYLNGTRIGSADNMNISYRFPVSGAARCGTNKIRVTFYSPVALTVGRPARAAAFTSERLYTRRIQCSYYWDWLDRFVSAGIYRPCYMLFPSPAELKGTYIYTRFINKDEMTAQIGLEFEFDIHRAGSLLAYTVKDPDGVAVYSTERLICEPLIKEKIDIPDVRLWYPNTYGEQPLYTVETEIYRDAEKTLLCEKKIERIGIRTVRILELPDKEGGEFFDTCREIKRGAHVSGGDSFWDRNTEGEFSGFIVSVNGVRIMCRGANWVPCEPFPSAETDEKISLILSLAAEGGMNMVRVWGGGVFEKEHFYSECDRLGLLVTQDFLMACGNYPEDDPYFLEQQKKEAQYAARLLRSHPCIAWYSGDNENGMGADENMPDYTGRRTALGTVQPVIRELDPYRDFLPSSPYRGKPYGSISRGTTHYTNYLGYWFGYFKDRENFDDYKEYFDSFLCRFCAEYPAFGAPQTASLRKFMTEDDIFGEDESMWRYHTKSALDPASQAFGIYDCQRAMGEKLCGAYRDGRDRVLKMQFAQYEFTRISMELYRRKKWFSAGIIYWMLNDCWPASGWAIIDYYALPKAAWYAFRNGSAPVIPAIERKNGEYSLFACSDSIKDEDCYFRLYVYDTVKQTEQLLFDKTLTVAANLSGKIFGISAEKVGGYISDSTVIICDMTDGHENVRRTALYDRSPARLRAPEAKARIAGRNNQGILIRAENFCRAVMLDGEWVFSDNCFMLKAGEEKYVELHAAKDQKSTEIIINCL